MSASSPPSGLTGTSPTLTSTAEYSAHSSPFSSSNDFLYFTQSPDPSSQSPMARRTPHHQHDYHPSTSMSPLSEHSIKIEPMGAVGIFALYHFNAVGALIGIKQNGDLEILPGESYIDLYIRTPLYRFINYQNGDQHIHLKNPIKKACSIYSPANPYVGTIFLFASLGAVKLIIRYILKEKPLVVDTLLRISGLFFEHVKKCHAANPYPKMITDQLYILPEFVAKSIPTTPKTSELIRQIGTLNDQIRSLNQYIFNPYQPSAAPASHQSAPVLIPTAPGFVERPIWRNDDLEDFSNGLMNINTAKSMDQPVDDKLAHLMQTIHTKSATARTCSPSGRYS